MQSAGHILVQENITEPQCARVNSHGVCRQVAGVSGSLACPSHSTAHYSPQGPGGNFFLPSDAFKCLSLLSWGPASLLEPAAKHEVPSLPPRLGQGGKWYRGGAQTLQACPQPATRPGTCCDGRSLRRLCCGSFWISLLESYI